MTMADEPQKRELLQEQMRIRSDLPESERTRLALVLPGLDRTGSSLQEEWKGDG